MRRRNRGWLRCGTLGIVAFVGAACSDTATVPVLSYDLEAPSAVFHLSNDLKEISGITALDDGRLGAVQDEDGVLFILDIRSGTVTDTVPFAREGDYEGIARAGEAVFVLRSNGKLVEIADWQQDDPQTTKHKTGLDDGCDAEGLAYDAAGRRLLIACKVNPNEDMEEIQAIYAFSLDTHELAGEPEVAIHTPTLDDFKPSALAIHPVTGHLFVLSAAGKALIESTEFGTVVHQWELPGALFEQPEGLAFLPNGDLFISSEGNERDAIIARFDAQRMPAGRR